MEQQITIEQLQEAIKDYQEAVDAADSFTDTRDYESYLADNRTDCGLCYYLCFKNIGTKWVRKYVFSESELIYNITTPEHMTIKQMRFCVEIRLTTLKWELGLRLAEQELKTLQS